MGQQQIFMIILVLIIVVLAVLLGMQLIKTENVAFIEDEYSQIMLETAEFFQSTYEKPELFGGGNHSWAKVNFNNVPCTFGDASDPRGQSCRADDGSLIIFTADHGHYLALNAIAHIGGEGIHHMYSRELRVHRDSLVFATDWIGHQ